MAPRPATGKEHDPAYWNTVPVYQPKLIDKVYSHAMKTPAIMLLVKELLCVMPEVHARFCKVITLKHVPMELQAVTFADTANDDKLRTARLCCGEPLEPGSVIIPDPYNVYLSQLGPGQEPQPLMVVKESHVLHVIIGCLDGKTDIEGMLDGSVQIIAISEGLCHHAALSYNPTVQLYMQSVNGTVNPSLSIVRNVPFLISGIMLYLQVHVIRNAPYDLLLGHPFNVLTCSVIKNFDNEDQMITIKCPNTRQVTTIPMQPHGKPIFQFCINGK